MGNFIFGFTIRDVLWLTVVVALSVALWREYGSYERAYLDGAAAECEVWRHAFKRYREEVAIEAELVRKRYNIPYPALPADPNQPLANETDENRSAVRSQ